MFNKFRSWVRTLIVKDKKRKFLEENFCDSRCPECKKWESEGNVITTKYNEPDDGTEIRTCGSCNHTWRAIFTPAGFIPID